jgi:hypothetical protein
MMVGKHMFTLAMCLPAKPLILHQEEALSLAQKLRYVFGERNWQRSRLQGIVE